MLQDVLQIKLTAAKFSLGKETKLKKKITGEKLDPSKFGRNSTCHKLFQIVNIVVVKISL